MPDPLIWMFWVRTKRRQNQRLLFMKNQINLGDKDRNCLDHKLILWKTQKFGWMERAPSSNTCFVEVTVTRKGVFRDRIFNGTVANDSKGEQVNAFNTVLRSQVGTLLTGAGFKLETPLKNVFKMFTMGFSRNSHCPRCSWCDLKSSDLSP